MPLSCFRIRVAEVMIQAAGPSRATTVPVQAKVDGGPHLPNQQGSNGLVGQASTQQIAQCPIGEAAKALPTEAARATTDLATLSTASLALRPSSVKSSSELSLALESSWEDDEGDSGSSSLPNRLRRRPIAR